MLEKAGFDSTHLCTNINSRNRIVNGFLKNFFGWAVGELYALYSAIDSINLSKSLL